MTMARGKNKTEKYYFKISDTFDEFIEKYHGKLSYILNNFDEISEFIKNYNDEQKFLVYPKFKRDKDFLEAFSFNLTTYHNKNGVIYNDFEKSEFKNILCIRYFPHVSPDSI